MGRRLCACGLAAVVLALGALAALPGAAVTVPALAAALLLVAARDALQEREALLRNYPLLGRAHFVLEALQPLVERYLTGPRAPEAPFPREVRALVEARAAGREALVAFGAKAGADVAGPGSRWVEHSLAPVAPESVVARERVGGPRCRQPYLASVLNVSALSFGALSHPALQALSAGARLGGFACNTGEGGLAPAHLEGGGDLVWQIGTAYFGCRTEDGRFDPERFQERARQERVRMIELKLSQGAKPGHGGLLPAAKVTAEIAEACGIPEGVDSLCPAAHPGLDTPRKLLEFVERLRELSGGKPVGLKLCLGRRSELLGLCKAMVASGLWPDFIAVDGGEGGSGAAPRELALHAGAPLDEALPYVHDALTGVGLREHVRLVAAGRIATGFDLLEKRALGADLCAAGRAFMLALGCLQAFECDRNTCPTGVATQDRRLSRGLVVRDKERRVAAFHGATVRGFQELMGSMGLRDGRQLTPGHVLRREADGGSRALGARRRPLEPGALLGARVPEPFAGDWAAASADHF